VSVSTKAMVAALGGATLIFEGAMGATPADLPVEPSITNVAPISPRPSPINPRAAPLVDYAISWFHEKKRLNILSVSRQECMAIFGHGMTRQILIEKAGEVESYLDGANRRISTESVCRRLIALAIMSHPLDGPELKARQPVARYQKRRREPTRAELEGLRKGNEGRALEAARKREAHADRV
jgi:hypothetical protein